MDLEKLKQLRDSGVLTQEEFDRQIANYLNGSENSDNKKKKNTENLNNDSGSLKIKHLLRFLIIGIGVYFYVEAIFPEQISCKDGVSEKSCACIRQTIAHNVNFLDKIKILIAGVTAEELSYYISTADALRCTFLVDDKFGSAQELVTKTQPTLNDEQLRKNNFSNLAEDDLSSDIYKTKFWYGNSKEQQVLKEKYFKGNLSEDELFNFCDSITSCNASMRNCKEVYQAHHGSSDPYVILDVEKLSEKQLSDIAIELCGKKVCESENEIRQYNKIDDGIGIYSWFCGNSGCFLGDYTFPHGDIDVVIEKITQKRK